jgi:hypothetical protein
MKIENAKVLFAVIAIVGLLLLSSPLLNILLVFPKSEPFSGFYILGPTHMLGDYPFNIVPGQDYFVYLGLSNHLYSSAYYKVNVKFCGADDQLPNLETGTPSSLPSLYTYRMLLKDGEVSENVLTLSVPQVTFLGKTSYVDSIVINGNLVRVDRSSVWDSNSSAFYYQLFFELWLYDSAISDFRFNNRSVGFWINMTQASS